ncbi:MAG: hypothetical protein QG608_3320 [Actinomycetota bacterium]|nr:hypothetical protein [Actinomycetota bacterium]
MAGLRSLPGQLLDRGPIEALARFGLPEPEQIEVITAGLMNRNWKVSCAGRHLALKQVLDVGADQARFQHRVSGQLNEVGLPVPVPLHTPDGETLVETTDGFWSASPWVQGETMPASIWALDEVRMVGELLGRVHQELRRRLGPVPHSGEVDVTSPHKALDKFAKYRRAALAEPRDGFDELVVSVLVERAELVERYSPERPIAGVVTPMGWCHGDFHDLNLLWEGGRVSAVLDWDRLGARPVAGEVVRTATLCFAEESGLDLERVAAFVGAYCEVTGMPAGHLADSAHRLWWERVCDVWQLGRHYDRQDCSCDHLFRSASALVPWWCTYRDKAQAALSGQ